MVDTLGTTCWTHNHQFLWSEKINDLWLMIVSIKNFYDLIWFNTYDLLWFRLMIDDSVKSITLDDHWKILKLTNGLQTCRCFNGFHDGHFFKKEWSTIFCGSTNLTQSLVTVMSRKPIAVYYIIYICMHSVISMIYVYIPSGYFTSRSGPFQRVAIGKSYLKNGVYICLPSIFSGPSQFQSPGHRAHLVLLHLSKELQGMLPAP